jgi:hypothetical protein|tara:strand:- start:350 stop:523 length:174 start_codon:yes stop_codon:yes gene_type:complete
MNASTFEIFINRRLAKHLAKIGKLQPKQGPPFGQARQGTKTQKNAVTRANNNEMKKV